MILLLKRNNGKSSGQSVWVQERVEGLPGAVALPGLDTRDALEVGEVFRQVLHRVLGQVQASVDLHGGEALVGETGHVEFLQVGNRRRREDLPDPVVRPPRPLPPADVGHLEVPEIAGLGQEVREVGQADPWQPEVFQVDEGNGVAVEEGDVGGVDVEDVVGGLFNVEAFKIGTRIDQPRKVEVVGRNLEKKKSTRHNFGYAGNLWKSYTWKLLCPSLLR